MSNVIEQLAGLGPDVHQPVSDDTVRRDMARGRAALRRRRYRRGITGLGATAAVAVTAVAVIAGQPSAGPANTGLDLVAYDGAQLPGFTVGKVPEGFVLQGSNRYSLDIAPASDHSGLDDYRGKLVVMLQSKDATGTPAGKAVEVNGHPGTISTIDPTAAQLFFSDGTHEIVVQSASELGLTNAELVEFASAVTVTDDAEAGVG
ncbi:MAG: hypothetical protein JF565_00150 [Propionibacteriales bacterium]|nr:hypothetical protein [Propionibacteriales bacterium]